MVEVTEKRLESYLSREVKVSLTEPHIEIDALAHSAELKIEVGNYKHVQMVSLHQLDMVMNLHHVFETVISNFIYQFIKDAAQRL